MFTWSSWNGRAKRSQRIPGTISTSSPADGGAERGKTSSEACAVEDIGGSYGAPLHCGKSEGGMAA